MNMRSYYPLILDDSLSETETISEESYEVSPKIESKEIIENNSLSGSEIQVKEIFKIKKQERIGNKRIKKFVDE